MADRERDHDPQGRQEPSSSKQEKRARQGIANLHIPVVDPFMGWIGQQNLWHFLEPPPEEVPEGEEEEEEDDEDIVHFIQD
jgi:hypothetical protein